MIVEKGLIDKMKLFGLNSYEAKIWVALLSRGVSSAGELSDISSVPRSRSYDVLESLEKKGFIVMKIGKPIKYIAVPPEEVLERVKSRVRTAADDQVKTIENLRESDLLSELTLLHNNGIDLVDPSDLTASFKGRDRVYDQILFMLKTAENDFDLITSVEGLKRESELLVRAFKKAHERGVKIRIAAPITEDSRDAVMLLESYAEIRHMDHIKARFAIADGREMTFLLFDDADIHPTYDVGVWINTEYFSQAIQTLFDTAWETLRPATEILE